MESDWSKNVNVASALALGLVGPVMTVSGGATTVQVYDSGVWSAFRPASTARTRSVCWPASSVNSTVLSGGPAHSLQTGTVAGSIAHSKVASGSVEEKTN